MLASRGSGTETGALNGEGRVMRADAVANREAIVVTAMNLFADVGVDVSLRTVAAEAGVGIGTLYRHFPSREDLLRGVGEHVFGLVAAVVSRYEVRAVGDEERAWRTFVGELVALRLGRLVPQLAQDVDLVATGSWRLEMRQRALLGLDGALARAKAAGLVRQDVDVARFQVGISQLSRPLPPVIDELVPDWEGWLVEVYLRGLRP